MKRIIAALGGALVPLSLAPFNIWPIGILCMAILAWALDNSSPKEGFFRGWLFGSGSFLTGVSWIFVAMYVYGDTSAPLSALMTAAFCIGIGLIAGLFGYSYSRWLRDGRSGRLLGFAAGWVLFEWLRGWFMTGFPWLYLGYGHLHSPLAGWAPVLGIYGLTFWVALSGAAVAAIVLAPRGQSGRSALPLLGCVALLGLGASLQRVEWTQPADKPALRIGAIQSNITQDKKWAYSQYWATLELYDLSSEALWDDVDIVVWPEAAIPALYRNAEPFFDYVRERATENNTALITGVPTKFDEDMYNSLMVIAGGEGIYHKQRLVPFGEYVPLASYIRGLIGFFDLPMSSFSRGGPNQAPLTAAGWSFAPSICYEIVYPDLIARSTADADVLLTVSNDAWFGNSIGPAQHMQMAQMRALENGRELLRVTSTGITAIVDHRGNMVKRIPSFTKDNLIGELHGRAGHTPFSRWGSTPVIIACALLAAIAIRRRR